jgi:hypothetical protein
LIRTYKADFKKRSVNYLNLCVEFLEKELTNPDNIDLYEKVIKRRVTAAKESYDDRKIQYTLHLLRYFTEKYFSTDNE